jgi:PTH1 family peptidyl-tRNA hydrolase
MIMKEVQSLIVGLGNPGRKYRCNRHSFGFMVADRLAVAHGIKSNRVQSQAIVGYGRIIQ